MQDHMQREEQPYFNWLIDLTLLTPKDTKKGTNTSNAVQRTPWTTCASVDLELRLGWLYKYECVLHM